jgi:hydrogenase-4 component B
MMTALLVGAIGLALVSGVPGLFFTRGSGAGERLSTGLLGAGALAGIACAAWVFAGGGTIRATAPWPVPGGEAALRVDALSAMFLVQIFGISLLGSIYALGYYRHADRPDTGPRLRVFYGALTAGMALLVSAENTVLFLAGWEVMALAAFFCVTAEDDRKEVREAGYVYLAATHVGTLSLFGLFAVLHEANGSFLLAPPPEAAGYATAIFLLSLLGFGMKAGWMPLHFWLPGAHANAPSHVSAFLSGVLVKMGVYGLVRILSLFPHPPPWWGAMVLGLGAVSGVLGVAFALGQHDLKRLLAYHTVENVGIIAMGIGLAVLGRSYGRPELMVLGLAGALLHVWNHGLFKALLFLSAGSVVHATGTREIDRLGGLSRRMPYTAGFFLLGAVAICGLPPLNGFVSELLVYLGAFRSFAQPGGSAWIAGAVGAPALALIGGLAVACFVKAHGAIFLGSPRSAAGEGAHEAGRSMLHPMAVLAGACVAIGLFPSLFAPVLDAAVNAWAPEWSAVRPELAALAPLKFVTLGALGLAAVAAVVWFSIRPKFQAALPAQVGTWDCGYAAPGPTMQYTASSFAQMAVGLMSRVLRPRVHREPVVASFPTASHFHSEVPEAVLEGWLVPAVKASARAASWLRFVQSGSVHAYLAYVLATLLLTIVALLLSR